MARNFIGSDPTASEHRRLLRASLCGPLTSLDLAVPAPQRRGGTRERRRAL